MKYLFAFLIIFSTHSAVAKDWYEGAWLFDPHLTQEHNPGINSHSMATVRDGFDKWAGRVEVTPRRIKGKKAKMGVPYRVVGGSSEAVVVEVKGGVVGIVKAFNPNLRNTKLRCKITRVNHGIVAFEVPELRTIKMYMRQVR